MPENTGLFARLGTCWKLTRSAPWQHQVFIALILLQATYLLAERIVLIALYTPLADAVQARAALWFGGIIIVAAAFVAYYAINSILTVNFVELVVFRILSLWLLLRVIISYAFQQVGGCGVALFRLT
jgi:hypothetical protein